mgnify:CR=1 FL=1
MHRVELSDFAPEAWRSGLELTSALCVVGGRTFSGLTTTLHASARELERMGRKVGLRHRLCRLAARYGPRL